MVQCLLEKLDLVIGVGSGLGLDDLINSQVHKHCQQQGQRHRCYGNDVARKLMAGRTR